MANLYEILAEAQNGEAMAEIGRAYGLTQEQTDAAVAALLPAISMGLKRATETPEGLGNLFALMAQQPDLYASYNDPRVGVFAPGHVQQGMRRSPRCSARRRQAARLPLRRKIFRA